MFVIRERLYAHPVHFMFICWLVHTITFTRSGMNNIEYSVNFIAKKKEALYFLNKLGIFYRKKKRGWRITAICSTQRVENGVYANRVAQPQVPCIRTPMNA